MDDCPIDIPALLLQPPRVSGYRQLLDATIAHLEGMREAGARFVPVSAKVLSELSTAPAAARRSPSPPANPNPGSTPRNPPQSPASAAPTVSTSPTGARALPAGAAARWSQVLRPTPPAATKPAAAPTVAPPPPLPPKLDPTAKQAAMDDLRRRALACVRCPNLVAARQSVVFGVGDIHARVLFVGEAPGADEDRRGEPFVGAAGELLTKIIGAMELSRDRVFIANVLKCRPDTPGQSSGNRKPSPEEMATCLPWLQEQIGIIQPEVMVALGATAVEGLLGKTAGITQLRGQWQTYRGIPLMPTYHPAFLLYSGSPADKRRVWEDMLAVMERLSLPISARQRGFFLPREATATDGGQH
ncbi:MAG: Type-4 uracil-DNA glycosylase [Verrucomicrobiota bacterium]|jgi:DNA polymerase